MNRKVLIGRVGPDGVLNVTVPLDPSDAFRAGTVTVEPSLTAKPLSPEEEQAWVATTAGSIPDPTFN